VDDPSSKTASTRTIFVFAEAVGTFQDILIPIQVFLCTEWLTGPYGDTTKTEVLCD
jgi:hypothetical protein